jgi:GNAT superfamily N-acetyltransferase
MQPSIRTPRPDELEGLRDIERAAGVLFAEAGMPDIATNEPTPLAELREYVRAGRAWVVAVDDRPVGYAVVDVIDGNAHLEQISVHPDVGRRGLGAALLHHVCVWAGEQDYAAVTLTTFADLPFNAPFYAKHGFRVLAEDEIGPELRAKRAQEGADGLDLSRRVCMSAALGR